MEHPHALVPEGEERPPRGVRAAAAVRWALVALTALAAAGTWTRWAADARGHVARSSRVPYRCPMHPGVVQDGPGTCPICKMDLVPGRPGTAAASPEPQAQAAGGLRPVEISPERTQLIGMRTATVTRERVTPRLRAVGHVAADASGLAVVGARSSGWVRELRVARPGQRVARGEVLATFYSPELVTAQQAYLNSLQWADRQRTAGAARGAGARPLDDDARVRLELLGMAPRDIVAMARARRPTAAVPIRSPVAGYVSRAAAVRGQYVQPGSELFQVTDLSALSVVAELYEADAGRVREGDHARVTFAALPGASFEARVQLVDAAVDAETRTLQARLELTERDERLRPGMYGDVLVDVGAGEGLAVPREAIVETGDHQYVFLARPGGRFEPRDVRLGARGDRRVQVLDGLAEGDVVVTTANFLVDSESRLSAVAERLAPAPDAVATARAGARP